jgi:hypothetical protein
MSSYHLKKICSCFRRLSIECSSLTKLTGGVNVHKVGKYGVKAHLHKSFQELWGVCGNLEGFAFLAPFFPFISDNFMLMYL